MEHTTQEYSEFLDGMLPSSLLEYELADRLIKGQKELNRIGVNLKL